MNILRLEMYYTVTEVYANEKLIGIEKADTSISRMELLIHAHAIPVCKLVVELMVPLPEEKKVCELLLIEVVEKYKH